LILESLSYAMLPHSQLKSSASIQEYTSMTLEYFEQGLRRRLAAVAQPPFLVTIARSMDDGFTPDACADYLQDGVKRILHKCFCGNDCEASAYEESCRLRFMYDYESNSQVTVDSH